MEFPDLGSKCNWSECKQLEFLPFQCTYCKYIFCKNHFFSESHQCKSVVVTNSPVNAGPKNVQCSFTGCSTKDIVEMLCVKCNFHFCLKHRYHSCFKYSPEEIEKARRILNEPREQFQRSLQEVNIKIDANIEKAKKSAKNQQMALKVQLMRLKGKAVGPPNTPVDERLYFLVHLPLLLKGKAKSVYCSKEWNVGRVIDAIAALCSVSNKNNEANAKKLRLFKKETGILLSSEMGVKLSQLVQDKVIFNGESLILEYIPLGESLDNFLLNNTSEYCE